MLLPILFAVLTVKTPEPHHVSNTTVHKTAPTPRPISVVSDSAGHKIGNVTVDLHGISGSVNVVGCDSSTIYSDPTGKTTGGHPSKILMCRPSNQQIVIFGK